MLKIYNTPSRNIFAICKKHYYGIKPYILRRLRNSRFNQHIKQEIENRLEYIITGNPESLIIQEKQLYRFILTYRRNRSRIDDQLKYIFDYSGFVKRRPNSSWNAYKLADQLKVNTCFYCNRQYTFTVRKNGQKITRPQFDHYFSQSDHPLLGVSFYNLIPCCSICNQLKGDEPFTTDQYLYPYETGCGSEANFTFIPKDYRTMVGLSDNMSIKLLELPTGQNREKINRQKDFFKLEEIYQEHADYVQEIILKAHISKGQYFKWLQHLFGKGISTDDIYKMALGNYSSEKDFDKRVLSKLTKDIAKEVKLIK